MAVHFRIHHQRIQRSKILLELLERVEVFTLVWSGNGTCGDAGRWITFVSITVSQPRPKWIKEPLSSLVVR